MINLYLARTDMTGDLTKWFTDRDQAVAWAEQHYADEAHVCQLIVNATPEVIVDLLNGDDYGAPVIWEKTPAGVPV